MTDAQVLFWADIILVLHFTIAAFNALSLPVIWIGRLAGLAFVHNPWFRWSHVGLMGFVLLETMAGKLCPLTVWEGMLRRTGGQAGPGQSQSFVGHWASRILFQDFSQTQFAVAYALFFGLILLTLFLVPVRYKRKMLPGKLL
ncbi:MULTISPECIES: DUF2784 domain-containing protein [unclassified Pseudodesulfovibrio]|uniref:DUF2784 domain-containing protein n=1 Tax=unclassified Pseudodesulfovibrio TaxID=2661612 RepID=UPI000FEBD744|nr:MULTISPECIES: DUF2784 domain-containing protein [unclassified Pseudodesulfovibrio]MCJ2165193.1 DUF2784 domain-containing protein [Pseudodesulfovibrio sp. S3-i]RWU03358.1 DUF2784 family protein [Pseudodesulfovibrio sp. S3]